MLNQYQLTGAIDELRLAVAQRVDGGEEASEVTQELKAVLVLLTAAADRAEEAGL